MNLARIPGQIIIGHLSDLVDPRRLILTMAGLSAASVYAFWGRADGEPLLLVFSLLFGAFAGRQVVCSTHNTSQCSHAWIRYHSYTALFPRFIAIVSGSFTVTKLSSHYVAETLWLPPQTTTRIFHPSSTPFSPSLEALATSHQVRCPLGYWLVTLNSMRRAATDSLVTAS